jgi:hypothetical protein
VSTSGGFSFSAITVWSLFMNCSVTLGMGCVWCHSQALYFTSHWNY